jgi:transcriptional regulator GlxA family with amidase domain
MAAALAPAAASSALDPAVLRAVAELERTRGAAPVSRLATQAAIGERQFRRRFLDAVGLTPKQLARVIRVRSACIHLAVSAQATLASIAHEAGYADQAHFSRELREVFGSPARALSALIRGYAHGRFVAPSPLQDVRFLQDAASGPLLSMRP